uniref:Lipoprotein n=1 Tax=viral metagenome TaxID=1070528 RepID=A0A6M3LEY3_9ZZZZ
MIKRMLVVVVISMTMGCGTRQYVRKPDIPVFPQTFSPETQIMFCSPSLGTPLRSVGVDDIDKLGKAWGYRFNNGIPFVEPFPGAKGNPGHKFKGE